MAWRMLLRRCPTRSMTVVGDVAQTGAPWGAGSWARSLDPHAPGRWRVAELTVNYRTPAEIMAVAADVLAAVAPGLEPPRSVREAGTAPWRLELDPAELPARLPEVVAAEAAAVGDGKLAVVVPAARARELGELLAAVLGGQVKFGVTGVGETKDQIEAGAIRPLAVTSTAPVEGLDVKTLKEQGIDLEFTNWRGWVAPPELSQEDKQTLVDLATKMHDSQQWKDALTKNNWTDAFMVGDQYAAFLKSEDQRVGDVLNQLGL
jgi:hypothetical protein